MVGTKNRCKQNNFLSQLLEGECKCFFSVTYPIMIAEKKKKLIAKVRYICQAQREKGTESPCRCQLQKLLNLTRGKLDGSKDE